MFTVYHNGKASKQQFASLMDAVNEAYYMAKACHPNCDKSRRLTEAPVHVFDVIGEDGLPRARYDASDLKACEGMYPMTTERWKAQGWTL